MRPRLAFSFAFWGLHGWGERFRISGLGRGVPPSKLELEEEAAEIAGGVLGLDVKS